jgi:uncharacterized membrane protein
MSLKKINSKSIKNYHQKNISNNYNSLIKINHKTSMTAFFFNALYTSITFGFMFIINDYIDDNILDRNEKKYINKLIIHMSILFIFTFIIVYMFWFIFGWGRTFFG